MSRWRGKKLTNWTLGNPPSPNSFLHCSSDLTRWISIDRSCSFENPNDSQPPPNSHRICTGSKITSFPPPSAGSACLQFSRILMHCSSSKWCIRFCTRNSVRLILDHQYMHLIMQQCPGRFLGHDNFLVFPSPTGYVWWSIFRFFFVNFEVDSMHSS